jgi:hypothetical protein
MDNMVGSHAKHLFDSDPRFQVDTLERHSDRKFHSYKKIASRFIVNILIRDCSYHLLTEGWTSGA